MRYEIDKNTGFFVLGYGYGSNPTFSSLTVSGATTVGGQLTVNNNAAINGNLTVSGSFAAAGLSDSAARNARAARQGLVFDGTSVATAPMTTAKSLAFTFNATANSDIIGLGWNTGSIRTSISGGNLRVETNSPYTLYTTPITLGKTYQVVYVGVAGSPLLVYLDGVLVITGSNNLAADITANSGNLIRFGANHTDAASFVGTISNPNIYNRALSASEVVSLFESGVPSGADYNTASNTSLSTSALTSFAPFTLYSTFSSANGTSFSASDASANRACGTNASFAVSAGQKILVSFTLTQSGSDFPQVILCDPTGPTDSSNAVVSTAGANNITLTATRAGTVRVRFFSFGASNYSVSGLSVTRLGLLLAPDAGQAGGGTTWYDTSGNAANITWTSGVSWNVPTSGKIATSLTIGGTGTGLTLSPSSGAATLAINGAASGSAINYQLSGTNKYTAEYVNSSDFFAIGRSGVAYDLVLKSGNLLLGTTTDSSNGKLQLATHTTSAGGIGFGTGISFYSSSSNKLAIYNSSQPTLEFVDATKSYGRLETAGGSFYISSADASASLVLRSGNGTTALTLDSSQNATFAKKIVAANLEMSGTAIAAGTYTGDFVASSGADRSIFRAAVAATSNGFTVAWNNTTSKLIVGMANLPTSSVGLASGTLWNNLGILSIV